MNINRRKFFRVAAVGVAAASLPIFLQPEKIQGKPLEFYGWEEPGFDMLDNKSMPLASFDDPLRLLLSRELAADRLYNLYNTWW